MLIFSWWGSSQENTTAPSDSSLVNQINLPPTDIDPFLILLFSPGPTGEHVVWWRTDRKKYLLDHWQVPDRVLQSNYTPILIPCVKINKAKSCKNHTGTHTMKLHVRSSWWNSLKHRATFSTKFDLFKSHCRAKAITKPFYSYKKFVQNTLQT